MNEDLISYSQTMKSKESSQWYEAMVKEMNSLQKNRIQELVRKPEGTKVMGCKWIYKKFGILRVELK